MVNAALISREEGARAPSSLRLSLGRDAQAPCLARARVREFCERAALSARECDALTLLVSELVTNAVLHSQGPAASEIVVHAGMLEQGTVRVEVVDPGGGFDARPRDPLREIGGYGLLLVDDQATRWGVDREGGTRVWFELEAGVCGGRISR